MGFMQAVKNTQPLVKDSLWYQRESYNELVRIRQLLEKQEEREAMKDEQNKR